ncbi:MAG: hypothetical protein K2X80_08615 [Pseudomonadaceae bacterium]|nr:hypothetical protein [Pseudomonadaceae bacterium]
MAEVINIADRNNGLSPAMRNTIETLKDELLAAVDKARLAGSPLCATVGCIEIVKASAIQVAFNRADE